MVDYTDSKSITTQVYPVISKQTTNLVGRCEALLTPGKLKSKFLKGIDTSDYSNSDLKTEIEFAINEFESESKLFVNKVQMEERIGFDRNLYKSFVYIKTQHGPILSVEDLSVVSSNGDKLYKLPAAWIEFSNSSSNRQINLIPILSVFGATGLVDSQQSNAGLIFLQAVTNFRWLPGFFTIQYTVGLSNTEGQVPKLINDVIGMIAAIEILSVEQNKNKYTSTSVGQDGLNQGATSAGTKVYQPRIDMLTIKKDKIMGQIKARFQQRYYLSNI